MKQTVLILTALALSTPAFGQKLKPTEVTMSIGYYYKCVQDYSLRFAKTPASPIAIADASLSYCSNKRENVRAALKASQFGKHLTLSDIVTSIAQFEENARRLSIQKVLQARYPNVAPKDDEG